MARPKVWVLKSFQVVIEIRGSCHSIYQFQTFEAIQVPQVPGVLCQRSHSPTTYLKFIQVW